MAMQWLERLVSGEVPETETTKYLHLRHGVENGYRPGATLSAANYCEPFPPSCEWLLRAGATVCPKPAFPVDGHVDFAQAERDRLQLEAAMQPAPEPVLFDRPALCARYPGWDNGTINYAMDLGLLARPDESILKTERLAGPMIDIIEYWSPRAVEGLDRHLTRLFPNIVIKTFVR